MFPWRPCWSKFSRPGISSSARTLGSLPGPLGLRCSGGTDGILFIAYLIFCKDQTGSELVGPAMLDRSNCRKVGFVNLKPKAPLTVPKGTSSWRNKSRAYRLCWSAFDSALLAMSWRQASFSVCRELDRVLQEHSLHHVHSQSRTAQLQCDDAVPTTLRFGTWNSDTLRTVIRSERNDARAKETI